MNVNLCSNTAVSSRSRRMFDIEIRNSSRHNTNNETTMKAHHKPTMTLSAGIAAAATVNEDNEDKDAVSSFPNGWVAFQGADDDIGLEVGAILEKMKVLRLKDSVAGGGPTAAAAGGGNGRNSTNTTYSSFLDTFRRSFTKNPAITRSLVSQELLRLSSQERNAIYEEQHGVTSLGVDESCMGPEWFDNLLDQMAHELWLLPPELKSAYEQSAEIVDTATTTNGAPATSYLQDRQFRMRFLRAELFHPQQAARRFANFVQNLFELFGPQTFYRPPQLADFSKDELRVLNLGRIQLLPYRDRAGRRVIAMFPPPGDNEITVVARVKIHAYLWFVASEDIETQQKGMVVVTFHSPTVVDASTTSKLKDRLMVSPTKTNGSKDTRGLPSPNMMTAIKKYAGGMAVRMVAYHLCTPDTPYYQLLQLLLTSVARASQKCTMIFHVGQDIETRYELNGYGIPIDHIPVTYSGNIKTQYLKKWMQLRKSIESNNINDSTMEQNRNPSTTIECPRMNDVTFKQGQPLMGHCTENQFFRCLVESKHEAHITAISKEAKMELIQSIIEEVKEKNGRFLVWDNKTFWTEIIDDEQIYTKISIFFRNYKASSDAKINRQTALSSTYVFSGNNSNGTCGIYDRKRKLSTNIDGGDDQDDQKKSCFSIMSICK